MVDPCAHGVVTGQILAVGYTRCSHGVRDVCTGVVVEGQRDCGWAHRQAAEAAYGASASVMWN